MNEWRRVRSGATRPFAIERLLAGVSASRSEHERLPGAKDAPDKPRVELEPIRLDVRRREHTANGRLLRRPCVSRRCTDLHIVMTTAPLGLDRLAKRLHRT